MPDTDAEPGCEAAAAARPTRAPGQPRGPRPHRLRPSISRRRTNRRHAVPSRNPQRLVPPAASGSQMSGPWRPRRTAAPAKPGAATPTICTTWPADADGPADHRRIAVERAPPEVVGNDGHGGVRGLRLHRDETYAPATGASRARRSNSRRPAGRAPNAAQATRTATSRADEAASRSIAERPLRRAR